MSDNKLEAACALAFRDSLREQGTNIREANPSQLSVAFDAAAEAVALAVGPQPVIDDLDARMPKAWAERAVLEAAEEVEPLVRLAMYPGNQGSAMYEKAARFIEAIEALRAAKGGDE